MKISKVTQRKEKSMNENKLVRKRIHKARSWFFERSTKTLVILI